MGNGSYVANKISHMQRMGIPAGIGMYGGACPNWLKEQREQDEKKRTKTRRGRQQIRASNEAEMRALILAEDATP